MHKTDTLSIMAAVLYSPVLAAEIGTEAAMEKAVDLASDLYGLTEHSVNLDRDSEG